MKRPFQAQQTGPKYGSPIGGLSALSPSRNTNRNSGMPALMDGGLDLDFHGFTRLFHARGWLTEKEFGLCRRFYEHTRNLLPPPDLIVSLNASAKTISQRLASRDRINIASSEDTSAINTFIEEWLASIPSSRLLRLDISGEMPDYPQSTLAILEGLK
jgi:deoxyadenosine/deoxycytidine kinase